MLFFSEKMLVPWDGGPPSCKHPWRSPLKGDIYTQVIPTVQGSVCIGLIIFRGHHPTGPPNPSIFPNYVRIQVAKICPGLNCIVTACLRNPPPPKNQTATQEAMNAPKWYAYYIYIRKYIKPWLVGSCWYFTVPEAIIPFHIGDP